MFCFAFRSVLIIFAKKYQCHATATLRKAQAHPLRHAELGGPAPRKLLRSYRQSYEYAKMNHMERFGQSEEYRREELIRIIEHSVERLTLQELEALYYDMTTKNYIND